MAGTGRMSGPIQAVNSFHAERDDLLALHPTVKPVAMIADAIKDCSHRGGIILDSCAGSGTTVTRGRTNGASGLCDGAGSAVCGYGRASVGASHAWARGAPCGHGSLTFTLTMQEERGHECE